MSDYAKILAEKREQLSDGVDWWSEDALTAMAEFAAETELIIRFPLLYHQHDTQQ